MRPIGIATTEFPAPTKIALELHPDHPDFRSYDRDTGEHFFHVQLVTRIVVANEDSRFPVPEWVTIETERMHPEIPFSRDTTFVIPADAIQNIWA